MKIELPDFANYRAVKDFVYLIKDINLSFHFYWSNVSSSTHIFLTLHEMINIFCTHYQVNAMTKTAAMHETFSVSF